MRHIEGYVSEEIFNTGARIEWKGRREILAFLERLYFLRRPVQKIALDKGRKV